MDIISSVGHIKLWCRGGEAISRSPDDIIFLGYFAVRVEYGLSVTEIYERVRESIVNADGYDLDVFLFPTLVVGGGRQSVKLTVS